MGALLILTLLPPARASGWRQVGSVRSGYGDVLHFVDANDGWLIGGDTTAGPDDTLVGHSTRDGGATWDELHIPAFRESPNGRYSWGVGRGPFAAFRLDKSEAWVGGAELIAHTVDGGATWEITPLWPAVIFTRELIGLTDRGPLGVHGLHFHDRDQGLMLVTADDVKDGGTNGAAVLATHDGGHTWEQRAVSRRPPPNNFIGDSLSMASASLGWMTHRLGTLYVTTDSGATWRGTGYGVRRAHVAADGNVWATTAEGASDEPVYLARSSDLGQTWEPATVAADLPEEFSSHGGLSSLTLPQDGRGWAVGAFGVVLATEDGATWTREDTPTTSRLLDVQYVEGVVYATGEDGVVLKRDAASTAVHATAKRPTTWARTKAGQRRDGSR